MMLVKTGVLLVPLKIKPLEDGFIVLELRFRKIFITYYNTYNSLINTILIQLLLQIEIAK